MTQPGICATFGMWQIVAVSFMVITIHANDADQNDGFVRLKMSRVERGFRSTSGVVSTIVLHSVSACILYGTSIETCHAVNYDTSSGLCEVLSQHGSLLEMKHDVNYIFAAINNTHDLLQTGVQSNCSQGPVQWKEQATWRYIALDKAVYSDEDTQTNYVCKATVGDNELPGVQDNRNYCNFVFKDLIGFTGLYRTLVVDAESGLTSTWKIFNIGEDVPRGAFVGGHLSAGTPLYVTRAAVNGVHYTGYYNPDTALAYIHNGSVLYPTIVDLLIFSPSGPTTAGPTVDWPCPRYHVQFASTDYEYIEHYGPNTIPTGAVISGNDQAVAETAGAFNTPGKFYDGYDTYYSVYADRNGEQNWGYLLNTFHPYQWEPFDVGSNVPYNAFLGAYTIENDPLYIVMKETLGYSIGTYNSRTQSTEIEHFGINHPTSVQVLTLAQPQGSRAWSDAGYDTYSGPITALRVQHDISVTGIKCRFGAQWSHGFWSEDPAVTFSQIDLKTNEYITGVKISLSDTLDYVELFTNLDTYGPFGKGIGGKNVPMFTQCGQVHHFSGYLRWDENEQTNKTFSFAVHGESCT